MQSNHLDYIRRKVKWGIGARQRGKLSMGEAKPITKIGCWEDEPGNIIFDVHDRGAGRDHGTLYFLDYSPGGSQNK